MQVFPEGKRKWRAGEGSNAATQCPSLAYVGKPTYRGAGSPGCKVLGAAPPRCSRPHALPRSHLSLGREWGSAEAPGDAGEGRGAPPCSRRGSLHHAWDRSFVARTPAGRPALLPRYQLLCSCPARKTQLGIGGKDC